MTEGRREAIYIIIVLAVVVGGVWFLRSHRHDMAVDHDLRQVEVSHYNEGIIHKANIQKKCGIADSETMTDAWFKIDACIGAGGGS